MSKPNIIVIGSSAGGLEALSTLLRSLKEDIPASIFIVQHLGATSSSDAIVDIVQRNTKLLCKLGEDNETIQPATIYIAPTDHHLLLMDGHIRLTKGARENGFRPAIDTLFRSAAAYYGSSTIGVILTGMLYDGTVGMEAIKRSGGITIVQDPSEAAFPDMPQSVLLHIDVDYSVPAQEIGILLNELVYRQVQSSPIPADIKAEAEIVERIMTVTEKVEELGTRSVFICPDCGGPLWQMDKGSVLRYRCHTGHAYIAETLMEDKDKQLEETLWVAMRILEERKNMLMSLASKASPHLDSKSLYNNKIEEIRIHVNRLKDIIMSDVNSQDVLKSQTQE